LERVAPSSFNLPGSPVFPVLHFHAHVGKFSADAIGLGKIFGLAGSIARLDERHNFCLVEATALTFQKLLQIDRWNVQSEELATLPQAHRGLEVALASLVRQFVQFGDRPRGIYIIFQSVKHSWMQVTARALSASRVDAETVHSNGRLLRRMPRPVNRLAIVRHQHLKPQHLAGPIGQQFPDRDEVAKAL